MHLEQLADLFRRAVVALHLPHQASITDSPSCSTGNAVSRTQWGWAPPPRTAHLPHHGRRRNKRPPKARAVGMSASPTSTAAAVSTEGTSKL